MFHSGAGFGSGFGMSGILSAVFKTRVACHSFPCSETRSCSLIAFASRRRSIITVLLGLICIQWIQIKMEPVFLGWGTRALIPTSHFVYIMSTFVDYPLVWRIQFARCSMQNHAMPACEHNGIHSDAILEPDWRIFSYTICSYSVHMLETMRA